MISHYGIEYNNNVLVEALKSEITNVYMSSGERKNWKRKGKEEKQEKKEKERACLTAFI